MAEKKQAIREPYKDCKMYREGKCRGLNSLYCAEELKPCPFYKCAEHSDGELCRKEK